MHATNWARPCVPERQEKIVRCRTAIDCQAYLQSHKHAEMALIQLLIKNGPALSDPQAYLLGTIKYTVPVNNKVLPNRTPRSRFGQHDLGLKRPFLLQKHCPKLL